MATTSGPRSLDFGDWATIVLPFCLVLAVDPAGWFPFGPAKWLVWTVALPAVAGVLWHDRSNVRARVAAERSILIGWALLLGAIVLAAAVGVERSYAWFGTPERHLGVLAWIGFAVMWLAGRRLARQRTGVRALERSLVLCGISIGLWGCLELVGIDPVAVDASAGRVIGPFGNAAYTGAALTLCLPAAVALATTVDEERWWRIAGWTSAALGAAALIGTQSRGAWIGATIAAGVVAAARWGWRRAVAVVGLALIGVVALAPLAGVDAGDRVADGFDSGVESRTAEWNLGLRVLLDRPLLGAGPEGYRSLAPEHISEAYAVNYGRAVVPDRAHQGLLDIALSAGLLGLAAYVGLIVAVARSVVRRARGGAFVPIGLAAGSIGYLAQQQLLFPIVEIDVVWWLVTGAIVTSASVGVDSSPQRRRDVATATGVAAAALITTAALAVGIVGMLADRAAARAVELRVVDPERAQLEAFDAVDLRPDIVRYRVLLSAISSTIERGDAAEVAVAEGLTALSWSPGDPIVVDRLVLSLALRFEQTGEADDLAAARTYVEERLEFDANHPTNAAIASSLAAAADDAEVAQFWRDRARALGFGDSPGEGESSGELAMSCEKSGTRRTGNECSLRWTQS